MLLILFQIKGVFGKNSDILKILYESFSKLIYIIKICINVILIYTLKIQKIIKKGSFTS